jgi:hypothetical protein
VAIPLVVNGATFSFPQKGDVGYADQVTAWAKALNNGCLQLGGAYTLLSDLDLSAFGIKAPYFTSKTANPPATGVLRLAKTDAVKFRNNANSADLAGLALNAQDNLTANGVQLDGQCCAIYQANAATTVPNNTLTVINYAIQVLDTDSAVTTGASWHFTVPTGKGGRYLVMAGSFLVTTGATGSCFLQITAGGVGYQFNDPGTIPAGGTGVAGFGTVVFNLTAGQTISASWLQNTGVSKSTIGAVGREFIMIQRLV